MKQFPARVSLRAMRYVYLTILAFTLSAPALLIQAAIGAEPQAGQNNAQLSGARNIPCKTPENASMCYWMHGRLHIYNGTPSYRLWKIGTKRLLGIYSGPSVWTGEPAVRDNEDPELPASLQKIYRSPFEQAFADFEVCPLEPERAGFMQAACIESAKNIFIQKPDR